MQFYAADGTLVSTRDICNFENLPVEGLQRMEAIQTPFHSLHRIIYTLRMKYLLCSSPIEAPEGGKQTSPASRSASQRRWKGCRQAYVTEALLCHRCDFRSPVS